MGRRVQGAGCRVQGAGCRVVAMPRSRQAHTPSQPTPTTTRDSTQVRARPSLHQLVLWGHVACRYEEEGEEKGERRRRRTRARRTRTRSRRRGRRGRKTKGGERSKTNLLRGHIASSVLSLHLLPASKNEILFRNTYNLSIWFKEIYYTKPSLLVIFK